MTEGVIDDVHGGFRVNLGFMDLEKTYDRVNRETLWLTPRIMMWMVNFLMVSRV